MDQTQLRPLAQPRATIDFSAFQQQPRMDWGLNQSLGVSDFRTEHMSEEEARDELSEYAIYRLEKRRDDDRIGSDRSGNAWEFARTVEVRDLSKEDASAFIRQRDEEGRSVVEEKASFPLPLQELVERTHVSLSKAETEPAVFHWVLADLHSVKQKVDRHATSYFGSRSNSSYGDAKQYNSSRRSKHNRAGGSKSKKERVSVTMFFKRVPRPSVSAIGILEQQRFHAASIQKRNITAQQMQDNELNEQLKLAQQQSAQRQFEAAQRMRAIEASIQQQQQQQENQQKLQQKLFEQQFLQQQQHVLALQQQAQHADQNRARLMQGQAGPQVHQQNMPQGVGQGVGRGAGKPPVPPPPPAQARGNAPPTVPPPPKVRNAQQVPPPPQQQKPSKVQTRQQATRPRAYSRSAEPESPRSSGESFESEDDAESWCDTVDTPLSSQASDTPRSRRSRAKSRSRSRSRDRCHGRCKSHNHNEDTGYGFEPVRRMSRHDQHYLENQAPAHGMLRGREMFSPEPTVSLLDSIKQEAYDAGMRAVTRADREDMIYRQRTAAPPPQIIQRQHSVRVVAPPPRMIEDKFEFGRLRIDDDLVYERRRMEEDRERRRQDADYERMRQAAEYEHRRYDIPEGNYYPLESPRREVDERDFMRTRDWVSGEYENPFLPYDGSRRGSYGGRGR
ncbi:hypothetical protein F5X68DRAFT_207449 [Plectosphaerella plurivora]|uniref:Uncharacterized protein n=1 Tax=Plectosphaerella plurivora TaxID=936078 RepID=A0A9P8VCD6_9PEZI|nr:hypothetical protein F5X68DRAFT_207449 [Plectosphaerella plurivora]